MAAAEGGDVCPCSGAEMGWSSGRDVRSRGSSSSPFLSPGGTQSSSSWEAGSKRSALDMGPLFKDLCQGFLHPFPHSRKGYPPSVEASSPSEYPPCSPPISSISAQNLEPLGRGVGKEAHSDLPRSLRGRDGSQAVSATVFCLKFMVSFTPSTC